MSLANSDNPFTLADGAKDGTSDLDGVTLAMRMSPDYLIVGEVRD